MVQQPAADLDEFRFDIPCSLKEMELMRPRWKAKGFAEIAEANPMSQIVAQLQSSLSKGRAHAVLNDACVLLESEAEHADLLNRACFGRQIDNCDKDRQWFQLGFEEAFYMVHSLRCLTILGKDGSHIEEVELWEYMKSKNKAFLEMYKAYAHLRMKNWVVRPGAQYGVDFVAYRHHPALVHSEYAVLVLSESNASSSPSSARLRVWSDVHCSVRVCGSVAKILLVLSIDKKGDDEILPSCLEQFSVEERVIRRWVPERSRGECSTESDGNPQERQLACNIAEEKEP